MYVQILVGCEKVVLKNKFNQISNSFSHLFKTVKQLVVIMS